MAEIPPWALSGTYLEACNCEVICPCRRIGGRQGGRSTYGICLGALSWEIAEGHSDGVDLSGRRVVIVSRYDDDEPGSPWDFFLYLDDQADEDQRVALEAIYLGEAGGTPMSVIPGHHQEGEEVYVDELRSSAPPIEYAFSGRCGYEASFAYSSDEK